MEVLVEDPRKVTATQDQQPVQALLPYGSYPSLGDRVGVRRLDGRLDGLNPVGGKDVVVGARELAVTVTNEEPRPAGTFSVHRELSCSLDHPGPVRMVGDAGESNSPGMELDEKQDVEGLAADGRNGEAGRWPRWRRPAREAMLATWRPSVEVLAEVHCAGALFGWWSLTPALRASSARLGCAGSPTADAPWPAVGSAPPCAR